MCTMANDGALRLYSGEQQLSEMATLLFARNLQEALCLTHVGKGHLMLMVGGYNSQIHLYTIQTTGGAAKLDYRFSMLGHFNSVKAIAISEQLGTTDIRYVASGS